MKNLFYFFLDATKIALQAIFSHKLRSFLTLIGIIIGVASVVLVGASISGLNSYVLTRVNKELGANTFYITWADWVGELSQEDWEKMLKRNKEIELEELRFVQANCRSCVEVGGETKATANLKHQGEELFDTTIYGSTSEMVDITDMDLSEGRFFAPFEVEHSMPLCVIGQDVKDKFYPNVDPIGKTLRIQNAEMTIIGVLEKLGSMFGRSMDNRIYIPLTLHRQIFGKQNDFGIRGSALDHESFQKTIDEVRVLLRARRGLKPNQEDTFSTVDTGQIDKQVGQFTGSIAMVVTPVTLISLLVGGIVVMNIMLVSVTERTYEIGLRKAVGARKNQILTQFLIESSTLASVGGLLGLLLAAGLSWVVEIATPIPMTITIPYILLSLTVSGGIGMIFGIYPAYKASRLNPIIALTKN